MLLCSGITFHKDANCNPRSKELIFILQSLFTTSDTVVLYTCTMTLPEFHDIASTETTIRKECFKVVAPLGFGKWG